MQFNSALQEIIRTQKISAYRLATITGMDRSHMAKLVEGNVIPSIATIQRIAQGLGMKTSQLLAIAEQMEERESQESLPLPAE